MRVQLEGRDPVPDAEVRCPRCDAGAGELDSFYIDRSESRLSENMFWAPTVRAVRFVCCVCGHEFDAVEY